MPRRLLALLCARLMLCGLPVSAGEARYSPRFLIYHDIENKDYTVDTRYGFIDQTGQVVIPPVYDEANEFSEGLASVWNDGHWAFIDPAGKVVFRLPADCLVVSHFSEGLALVNVGGKETHHSIDGGKWGYIDRFGRFAVPAQFTMPRWAAYNYVVSPASAFSEGLAGLWDERSGKWGFIDRTGKVVIDFRFDRVEPFSEGRAAVLVGKTWGYIDPAGKLVVEPVYLDADRFSEGLAAVRRDVNTPGDYIDPSGQVALHPPDHPAVASASGPFREGLAAALLREWGRIPAGRVCGLCAEPVLGLNFGDRCPNCKEPVEGETLGYGYIGKVGNVAIESRFSAAEPFHEGLAAVKVGGNLDGEGGLWGFIDRRGRMVITAGYEEVEPFRDGLARVKFFTQERQLGPNAAEVEWELWGYVNRGGEVVWVSGR